MDQQLQALPMNFRDARLAYPLISMHDASISLDEWLRFAKRICTNPAGLTGMIGISDRRGIVHAVFGYRVDIDMRSNKKLCLSNLVMAQMPGSMIDQALTVSASRLASRLGCLSVTFEHRFSRLADSRCEKLSDK